MSSAERTLMLFSHDWDAIAHQRLSVEQGFAFDEDGFDLFSFPRNARLAWFDMARFWRLGQPVALHMLHAA